MGKQELYEEMQKLWIKENGVVVGSKVKILRVFKPGELGFSYGGFSRSSQDHVGEIVTVLDFDHDSITAREIKGGYIPFFILEHISNPPITKTITIDGKVINISLESFNEFKRQFTGVENE